MKAGVVVGCLKKIAIVKLAGHSIPIAVNATTNTSGMSDREKMRIGVVSKFFPEADGIARFSENLCNQFFDKHHIVKIGDIKSGTKYRVNFGSFRLKNQLKEIINKENLDVLHIQYIPAYFGKFTLNLNLLQALGQRIPVVCTLHEVYYDYHGYSLPRRMILSFLEKAVVTKSGRVIAHTPGQKKFLEGKYGVKNIESVPLGLELFDFHERKGNQILFLGIISRMKGLELLIKAMELLPDYSLQIVGKVVDGEHEKEIRKMVDGAENISFRFEWVTDGERWDYFRNADLVVLPYLQAHQSGALNDAVSVGVPVVVTRVGALHEMAEQFGFGEIVGKSPEAIAEGIKKVSKDYDGYRKGLVEYRKAANWKAVAERHIEVYRNLLLKNKQK